ncbi:hypothetical protein [Haloarcula marismortui]|jgi:hypothetical protein|uniref:Uncharacterized protein n=1 Tax=Haloarcula marismortui ATCC 33799 TaxID=662475 RepID=M0K3U2_9EURY|nr:hypothetical protein [Haloarcula californiae]EMA14500.1 hypothetical protein C435_15523 [Haloarcula californiae ATCC 33799]
MLTEIKPETVQKVGFEAIPENLASSRLQAITRSRVVMEIKSTPRPSPPVFPLAEPLTEPLAATAGRLQEVAA